jgi:hypothetical protein
VTGTNGKLRVRLYNVRFGDAILVSVPDKDPATNVETLRHILIDVGNVLSGEDGVGGRGGDDAVFLPVIEDIKAELGDAKLDLYVMTHEHLDHVQGLFFSATKHPGGDKLKDKLGTKFAWLTASAAPDYYETHPKAKKEKKAFLTAYDRIARTVAALPAARAGAFWSLLANNNPTATAQCVDYLRTLAPKDKTFYVSRGFKTAGRHPFKECKFEIWAPEEDTSSYYKKLLPMADTADAVDIGEPSKAPLPPPGVDAGAFYDLVEARRGGFSENLLAIDKAANNTSIVFVLEWRGLRLLFSGDAEIASWKKMKEANVFKPVDFVKVSHHGSHNGTPADELLEAILPRQAGVQKRKAVISNWDHTYGGIPHDDTNARLSGRCQIHSILDDRTVKFIDTFLP